VDGFFFHGFFAFFETDGRYAVAFMDTDLDDQDSIISFGLKLIFLVSVTLPRISCVFVLVAVY
jgi:hypothetical protein